METQEVSFYLIATLMRGAVLQEPDIVLLSTTVIPLPSKLGPMFKSEYLAWYNIANVTSLICGSIYHFYRGIQLILTNPRLHLHPPEHITNVTFLPE